MKTSFTSSLARLLPCCSSSFSLTLPSVWREGGRRFSSSSSSSSSVIRLFPAALQSVAAQRAFVARLEAPHELGMAHKNVVLNPDRGAAFTHVEFTPDSVRLEFKTSQDEQYRKLAELKTEFALDNEDVQEVIRDVKNLDFCGGGASVILDREALHTRLRRQLRKVERLAAGTAWSQVGGRMWVGGWVGVSGCG
uniref:Uncharacterized protein n=1 Tax=Chromera velia CCMP2878 TaxID=1169474 RepID=A0A0G4HYE5_9ALVE|eukprot:Cvel_9469.t1-p1 / transcript=Cvel_9469.t1 / gene=Cvel_9469 / organism=Chromera_velia_CCMP2878 / gene_product=hypothetical protein / transcript_product=hypothetical protein / location=Cvel_scaffold546:80075-81070(+) / protein_length=193 / sequence_SO=supercontig / SO=protein_coding / is_pseudo=false